MRLPAFIFLLSQLTAPGATQLFVSPGGNDSWTGRFSRPNAALTDGPLATPLGARDAVRKLKNRGELKSGVTVSFAEGEYIVTNAWLFEPRDSGTARAPIIYQAAPGAHPVFNGGRHLRGWQPGANGIWHTFLPETAAGHWYFEQLWVNGRRATRARAPNASWSFFTGVQETAQPGQEHSNARRTVQLKPADFKALAGLTPEELKDVNLVVYHEWNVSRRFVRQIDAASNLVVTTGHPASPWDPWRQDTAHFILENALGFLDSPGEWFLDRGGTLYYQPLPGEDMNAADVVAPVTDKFLVFQGDAAAGQPVEYLAFKNLVFAYSQWLTPPAGFEPSQAAATIDAVVMVDGAQHITFDNCALRHLGTYAVWFRRGCRDDAVRHCLLEDLGAGGIRIGPMDLPQEPAEETRQVVVDNNIIRHGGRIFPCAVGVWIGFSPGNQVVHNEISDWFYTGVSVGWRWGYGASNCKSNLIAFNDICHLGQGVLSDMGGVYTLGPSAGTVVRNNVIHDVNSFTYGGWGLYPDEGSSDILFENNLVYDTKSGGFHQHYGSNNLVQNNIFVDARDQQLQFTRIEDHLSFTFENNIIYWTNSSAAWVGPEARGRQLTRNNCYWNAEKQPIRFAGKSLAQWQNTPVPAITNAANSPLAGMFAGHETGSIIADPLFRDPRRGDFRLGRASPAVALGFKRFDYFAAGVYGSSDWVAAASDGIRR